MDKSWESMKSRERELAIKKRGRNTDFVVEGERKPKRSRKMKHPVLEDNWGEEEDEEGDRPGEQEGEQLKLEEDLHSYGRGIKRYLHTAVLTPTHIPDYFTPLPKRSMEQTVESGQDFEEFELDDSWEDWATASSLTGVTDNAPTNLGEVSVGTGVKDIAPTNHGDRNHASTSVVAASSLTEGNGAGDTAPTSLVPVSRLTEEFGNAPTNLGYTDHASTSVGFGPAEGGGEEEDLLLMEDDWGDSPGTKEWFDLETERYVGYNGGNTQSSNSFKDPLLPSTNTTATQQEDDGESSMGKVPDKGTLFSTPGGGDAMPTSRYGTTGMLNMRQPSFSTALEAW